MPSAYGQIPLPFRRYDHYLLEHYWPGRNRHVLEHLATVTADSRAAPMYLWGESGTGKSHLLQAMCTRLAGQTGRSVYIPLQQPDLMPAYLEDLEQLDLVCVDDLEAVAGHADWERALFNLYNRLQESGKSVIFTANQSPNGLAVGLPDLRSRLQQCVIFHLLPLSEDERLTALRERARLRGLDLSEEVTTYLARRVPRGTHQLFRLLDRLDQASLAAKKRLTVPFVRQLLESEADTEE